jgi:hypothetical protein
VVYMGQPISAWQVTFNSSLGGYVEPLEMGIG